MQVLVIDSENDSANFIGSTLKIPWPDSRVVPCHRGEDGLDLAEREKFDLMVVDLKLPDTTGFEFLKRLVMFSAVPVVAVKTDLNEIDLVRCLDIGADVKIKKHLRIPVILLAAHNGNPERLIDALDAGADDYLYKPLDKIELQERVKATLWEARQ